ncbi:hypothetical protein TCA2_4549 [Paenibacillus sp. TCA20]|uniref:N-acetylglucosaminidase n=1 Tax=Paenibacillus sp. TCA20 TaxID=1499968 RepID=UPI0004D65322|nr:glucosaminidase domain-containing protein [Paenibacillus sp. TCA20]GAK42057.1 hypothetical protein TCA2_4549 [Paenibacillus sp. TCA20]
MATTLGYDDRDALYGSLRDHFLRLGDTQFYVPPTAINVQRRMRQEKINVLRGRGSFVKGSGYSDQVITLTLFFPDIVSINNELRPLLAQVRKCPFLPIENILLNNTYKIDAVTIASVNVQSVAGFPHSLEAQITMYAFNPFAYIMDDSERTFDEMFNWPLFRWHYQRNLKPDPANLIIYYEPLQTDLNNEYIFKVASEEDLQFIRKWRKSRNKLIHAYQEDMDQSGFSEGDYEWIDGVPMPKRTSEAVSYDEDGLPVWEGSFRDEKDEELFRDIIGEMYRGDREKDKVISEMNIFMENWDIPGLTMEHVSVGYENVITPLQLQMHESPTHQYLGSQDTLFVLQFFAEDDEALGAITSLVQRTNYLAREYHREVSNGFIQFDHQIARLFGARYMIIEDLQTTTVEGQPGAHRITLTMSSYNRAQRRIAETEWLSKGVDWQIGWADRAWWNLDDKPWLREDPFGGFMSLDVRKKAVYDQQVKEMMKGVEVYPDLELPTYAQVADAGFEIRNLNDGIYVDPDFFLIYSDPVDFGEQVGKLFDEGEMTAEVRDYMGGKGEVKGNAITPDDNTAAAIEREKLLIKNASAMTAAPDSTDTANMSTTDVETIIRKKAKDQGLDQRLCVALAKSFDTKLRQFYYVGEGANKDLGGITVTATNTPIMMNQEMKYFKDTNYLRNAKYIGVMRVSPVMGEPNGLANNIEYNVEQGIASLKYYLERASVKAPNDNVAAAFGLTDKARTKWVNALCSYLGYAREYNLLASSNKKMPANVTALIKKILKNIEALQVSSTIDADYSKLPVADYKSVSMNSAEPTFKEKILDESDFMDDQTTLREMYHDTIKYDRRGRLIRAFPTFFLMFIDEGQFMGAVKMSDQFFGYRAVTDITYTNSRKLASSTLVMEMANVFGKLTDAIKSTDLTHTSTGDLMQALFIPGNAAREAESNRIGIGRTEDLMGNSRYSDTSWYKSMYLRTGARIHFRMGYGSNPMNMPTMMNGVVTQVQNDGDTVTIVAQDDGIELTNKLKAKPDEQTRGFIYSTQEPTEIIDSLLTDNQGALMNFYANRLSNAAYAQHSLGIMHFGMPGKPINYFWRWELANRPQNEITMNIYETTGKYKQEQNGFWSKLGDFFGIGNSDETGININLYDKTVWDVLNITASVGEDFIVAVHPFDFRNTIFHGKPYFPVGYEYLLVPSEEGINAAESDYGFNPFKFKLSEDESDFEGIQILRKPFRQVHIYDSWTSIIDNGITATDENMYTVAQGVYYDEGKMDTTDFIYVDTNIWPEKQRTVQIDTQLNLQGVRLIENIPLIGHFLNKPFKWYFDEYTAIRIAAAGLRDMVKEMYDGYLTVMGDPSTKPHDQIYLYDTYTDMSGPLEVREVTHIMNFDVGYITMIKPDACVVNSDTKMTRLWITAGSAALQAFTLILLRNMMRNRGYQGTMPIMNALWASTKRRYNAMMGKWDSSWMKSKASSLYKKATDVINSGKTTEYKGGSGPIYEVDPITGEVREYHPVSSQMKKRWEKSGLLKALMSKIEGFTFKDGQNLFDKLDGALSNRRFLRYDRVDLNKIAKLKNVASEAIFSSAKFLGKGARWGRRGIQGILGIGAAALGPVGWIGFAVEFAITEVITRGISEWVERFLFTRQAVIIATLRKEGVEFSAGINGHQGSVIGDSPDTWQRILTGPVGSVLLGFLGADVSRYGAVDAGSMDDMYNMALDSGSSSNQIDMNMFAKNFFEAHRKPVLFNQEIADQYEIDRQEASAAMEGQIAENDEENERGASYPEEESSLLTMQDLQNAFGSASNADGTSFETLDLNKPSGISAEAIDKAFAGKGKLAGLGKVFVDLESRIPAAPSPLAEVIGTPNEGGRVINALYLAAHAAWETGWGTSRIFRDKNNLFGYGAYDSSPYESAYTFASPADCVNYAANKIKDNYLTPGGKYYNGPTLEGMNIKYATDKNWAKGIAGVMAKIASYDPNFQAPSVMNGAQTKGEKPVVYGNEGKAKYRLKSSSEAAAACINIKKQPLTYMKLTMVTSSPYIRQASYDLLEALGKAYKQKTGETICITSAFREGDKNWHGTGYGVDIDTPNAGYIGGKVRFAKGSKDKENLRILCELAIQVGFGGVIHGDVDVIAEMKSKYPNVTIQQRNDHYNHLHLSYPRSN